MGKIGIKPQDSPLLENDPGKFSTVEVEIIPNLS